MLSAREERMMVEFMVMVMGACRNVEKAVYVQLALSSRGKGSGMHLRVRGFTRLSKK
jgi:hypothetical protein